MAKLKRKDAYTKEQIAYLRKISGKKGRSNKETTRLFNDKFNQNRTLNAIVGVKSKHNITSFKRDYTLEQVRYLEKVIPEHTYREVAKMFNEKFKADRTETAIKSMAFNKGINSGTTGRFKKGDIPYNTVPVGTEVVREDGFTHVKIEEPNTWKQKQRVIWEEVNGPVPEKHVVLFGDKDRTNFDIDNLILVSKAQLLQLNRYDLIKEDADLTRTGTIIANLYLELGRLNKIRRENNK